MSYDNSIVTANIHEAVRMQGGNGLSTPAFQPPLNFLIIFAWVNVESGVEALVCNGEVLTKTKLRADFLRIIGRKSYFHRVLMKPAPLEIQAQALSSDEIKVGLDVSLKYEVIDPIYAASTQDPLEELSNLLIGVTAESMRRFTSNEVISADDQVKQLIKSKLNSSPIVSNHYRIVEILKVMPTIDESLINIRKQIKEATEKATLIEAQGQNKEIESVSNLKIARLEAQLQEEIKNLDHEKEIQKMRIQSSTEIAKAGLEALGTIGSGGIDPRGVVKDVMGVFMPPGQGLRDNFTLESGIEAKKITTAASSPANKPGQYEKEIQAFNSVKEKLGIISFNVIESNEAISGAVIQFHDFEIIFTCSPEYPMKQPAAVIRRADGSEIYPENYWLEGATNLLAQAVGVIASQA